MVKRRGQAPAATNCCSIATMTAALIVLWHRSGRPGSDAPSGPPGLNIYLQLSEVWMLISAASQFV
jgi:hypothetical protein